MVEDQVKPHVKGFNSQEESPRPQPGESTNNLSLGTAPTTLGTGGRRKKDWDKERRKGTWRLVGESSTVGDSTQDCHSL